MARAATAPAGALALGGAVVLGAATGPAVLLAAVLLTQATVIFGWHRSLDAPGSSGGLVVGAASALGADLVWITAAGDRDLPDVPAVLALAVVASVVHQLARRGDRDGLVESLTATATLAALAAAGSFLLPLADTTKGLWLVIATAISGALVPAFEVVRRRYLPTAWAEVAVVGAAAAVGAAVAISVGGLAVLVALSCAAAAAVAAWLAVGLVARSPNPHVALMVGLPLLLAAPAAYVVSRLVTA